MKNKNIAIIIAVLTVLNLGVLNFKDRALATSIGTNINSTGTLTISGASNLNSTLDVTGETTIANNLYVTTAGKLGIGTVEPLTPLHVVKSFPTSNDGQTLLTIERDSDSGIGGSGIGGQISFKLRDAGGDYTTAGEIGGFLGTGVNDGDGINIVTDGVKRFYVSLGGLVSIGTTSPTAQFQINQSAWDGNYPSGQNPTTFKIQGGAHFAQLASTEIPDIIWSLDRTVQFSTGALTQQRAIKIDPPTYSFVGSSTITNAATMAITGAPAAGTNATITNSYALWIDDGAARFDGRILGAKGIGVTAANDIILGSGNYFEVNGATQINTISATGWTAGSIVVLKFDGAGAVGHNQAGAGATILLEGGGFNPSIDDTLTLIFDGTYWRELSRAGI